MPLRNNKTGAQPSNYPNTKSRSRSAQRVTPTDQNISHLDSSDKEFLEDIGNWVSGSSVQNTQEPEINNVVPQAEIFRRYRFQFFEMSNSINVPKFSNESSLVPTQWWKLFESFQIYSKMNDEQAIASCQFHFQGQAQLWFNSLEGATRDNLQNLKAAFLLRFSNEKTSSQLFKIQQLDQESGHQYLTRIQQLAVGAANCQKLLL
ncbi:unnamed protein product [Mytilus edulis]|uniref:Retrotransposon gag domain-containing protein n=1 Tax=Mytilus edulis TaxID=6550 RepID=A0A8S3V435_MYTED|nr:unnamed protein product [Mytilus edulis]